MLEEKLILDFAVICNKRRPSGQWRSHLPDEHDFASHVELPYDDISQQCFAFDKERKRDP